MATLASAVSVTIAPLLGSIMGKVGDVVTPAGNPDRLTVTVPENPFSGINESWTCAFEFGEMETEEGLALTVNEGGRTLLACVPPPHPDVITRKRIKAGKQPFRMWRREVAISQRNHGLGLEICTSGGS